MLTRRQFLKLGAAAAAGLAFPLRWSLDPPIAHAFYQSPASTISKFTQSLRGVGPSGIPVALPDTAPAPVTGAVHYSIDITQYTDQLHSALGPTTLWGYSPKVAMGESAYPTRHLGGIIVAQKDVPIQLTFTNKLPDKHILPVDISDEFPDAQMKYGGNAYNAASTHLHGGYVPWMSDGGPMAYFTPAASGGTYGPSVADDRTNYFKLLNPSLQPGQAEYYYPNRQTARMMWYHDHAHDITRLNAYAGVATAYILRDSFEASLVSQGLPGFVENGGNEIPLVIQDKIFVGSDIGTADPSWPTYCKSSPGSLWYPHTYESTRWGMSPTGDPPDPSNVPEMFGDTMLVNGTAYPEATVEARRYRFRLLNACQARFLNLQLYVDDGSADGITLNSSHNPANVKGPDFFVIGTEGGFLSRPVWIPSNRLLNYLPTGEVNVADPGGSLLTGPAERWDFVVDFTGYAGQKIILYNDAPAPFPGGDDANDYYPDGALPPHNPTNPTPGYGPNTRTLMRFNIVTATSADPPMSITPSTDLTPGIDRSLVGLWTTTPLPIPPNVPVRMLTLNEDYDSYGRLIQTMGTNEAMSPGSYGRFYMDQSSENPMVGATEVWQIVNLTGDTHPIHFHLVNAQILSRQPFTTFAGPRSPSGYAAFPGGLGTLRGPDPWELGWKETVKCHPGEVTTVIMRFDVPGIPGIPSVPSLNPSLGVSGYEYVWHCHILDHEEHDMMRPLVVVPAKYYMPFVGKGS